MTEHGSRIIGGRFGLEPSVTATGSPPPIHKDNVICMLSARCCISLLVDRLRPRRIWMPSYLCPTMLDPCGNAGAEVRFYAVDDALSLAERDWLEEVGRGDLVVFIDYFGFPCPREHMAQAAERGAWVLEDACQAMLTEGIGRHAHFLLYSPRKLVGLSDGGILMYDDDIDLGEIALAKPPVSWWMRSLESMLRRRELDVCGHDRQWFVMSQKVAAAFPLGRYAMSELAHALFFHGFDYGDIAARRVANYTLLLDHLSSMALFKDLPSGVVPLGFPIVVRNRDAVRQALFAEKMYPPVHWRLDEAVPKEFESSHRLSRHILTLPCDQRYESADMDRMARTLMDAVNT